MKGVSFTSYLDPPDEVIFCEICGQNVDRDECICPECPECEMWGEPRCYLDHGLRRTEEQKFLLECAERDWAVEAKAERQYEEAIAAWEEVEANLGEHHSFDARPI